MKRYSIAPTSSRRKSTLNSNYYSKSEDGADTESATLELERLEQEITLVLQEIDKNISKANAVINDKVFPVLRKHAGSATSVWNNVNFWKYFLEQSANVELTSYEAPANSSTDINTLTNSKSHFLLSNEDEEGDNEVRTNTETDQGRENAEQAKQNKIPLMKGFSNIVENTPTWSTEEQMQPRDRFNMQASTPQLKQRSSFIATNKEGQDIGVTNAHQERKHDKEFKSPQNLQTSLRDNPDQDPAKREGNSPFIVTHTVRQSLDHLHKISISPRKGAKGKSKATKDNGISDDIRRRSSLIQNLIDSSPTLPEPPVLLSEMGNLNSNNSNDPSSQEKDLERLSPIALPGTKDITPFEDRDKRTQNVSKSGSGKQRFPTTPTLRNSVGSSNEVDIMRTPVGVRMKYGADDSDLPPPPTESNTAAYQQTSTDERRTPYRGNKRDSEVQAGESDELRLTHLQAIGNAAGERDRDSGRSSNHKKQKIMVDDDRDNVFYDPSKQDRSINSTVYHSMLHHQENKSGSANNTYKENSRDTTSHSNSNHSKSISHLFDEVLSSAQPSNPSEKQGNTDNQHNSTDLFNEVAPPPIHHEKSENDTTDTTSDLGSLLTERLKTFTNVSQHFGS
ncbi:Piso0_004963 [Millerozyma farinosa CBS 7064]|uniref:DASH complex subunit ASK1 n=1 Tax=Pichia sorbitophila (strain ATCC MYA-4447 / BCRC 22081 / CBS 7064 / NBRC 10061 / NRRL Y-12695) TaxID=559304 RepID=G8Y3V5_PICSO|nr:Piso0_004963 [Millerozyma farinosa CBS 7064]